MLKDLFFRLKNYYYLRKNKVHRHSVSLKDAQKVGILINSPLREMEEPIQKFINFFHDAGKTVQVICYFDEGYFRSFKFSHIALTKEDIDWKGEFKSDKINNFIKIDFDYLYSINISPFLPFENILLRSKAKFRIGRYFPNKEHLFEMMIKFDKEEKPALFLELLNKYTHNLKTNER